MGQMIEFSVIPFERQCRGMSQKCFGQILFFWLLTDQKTGRRASNSVFL